MILEFVASLSYNDPIWIPAVSARVSRPSPAGSRVAMIEMQIQQTTANGTVWFAAAAGRRTAKP